MKVLFQNMMLLTPGVSTRTDNRNYKDERIDYFLRHVLEQYDVLCLSEVWKCHPAPLWDCMHKGFTRREYIIEKARQKGYSAVESPTPSFTSMKVIDGGLLILSRLAIVRAHAQSFRISCISSVEFFVDNGFCHAAVQDADGEIVNIITAHLESDHTILLGKRIAGWGTHRRERQIQVILDYIQHVSRATGDDGKHPWILGGDLNIDANDANGTEFHALCDILGARCMPLLTSSYRVEATLGDTDELGHALDNVLTHSDDLRSRQFVDHAFVLCTKTHRDSQDHHHHKWKARVEKIKSTHSHHPFRHISDHHGVLVERRRVAALA
jgi:endonuclease/exonuclease/phosphatase family metal-dependent hydrolase